MIDMYKITDHKLEKYYGFIQGSIEIPSSVQIIGEDCFAGTGIEEICIPKGVIEISDRAFNKCSKLHTVTFEDGSQLRQMGKSAFSECESLVGITIPKNVTTIKERTFEYCKKLKEIELPPDISKIERGAFDNCLSLQTLMLPDTLEEIGD